MRSAVNGRGWRFRPALHLILVLAVSGVFSAQAADAGHDSTGVSPGRVLPPHHDRSSLEERVRILSQALDLDTAQQSALRKLLEDQREQIRKVWSNTAVPAAYRVSATQGISDKTADQIRSLLNDEQRKKYNPPKPPHEQMVDSTSTSVEVWMKADREK
jgi:hypothetical protein